MQSRLFLSKNRRDGYWYCYYWEFGKRKKVSTHTKLKYEAYEFLRTFQQNKSPKPKIITMKLFQKEFLEYAKTHYTLKTQDLFRTSLNVAIQDFHNPVVSSITLRQAEEFLAQKHTNGSAWTARRYHIALRSAFERARLWNYVEENVWKKIKQVRMPEQEPVYMKQEEAKTFLNAITDPQYYRLIFFALNTGVRLAEALHLQWTAIDMAARLVHVKCDNTFTTKTRRNRAIPMNDNLFELLSRIPRTEGSVFVDQNGKPYAVRTIQKLFKDYLTRAGLGKKYHFHTLRHTFASWLVQAGVSIYEVQKLLGHSTVTTTEMYAHLMPNTLFESVARIPVLTNEAYRCT